MDLVFREMNLDSAELYYSNLNRKKNQLVLKRLTDLVFSFLLLIILSPLFLLVALLIKISSKGPVLFYNKRIGYKGTHFKCYKFRSMRKANDSTEKKHIEVDSQTGTLNKSKNDSRITWIGRIIRKSSIDELPQLYNVLLGEMSLVGPRPLIPEMMINYSELNKIRALVRPGITGLWQTEDRSNNTHFLYMKEYDFKYISEYSFLLDIKLLLKTVAVVIKAEGAYLIIQIFNDNG